MARPNAYKRLVNDLSDQIVHDVLNRVEAKLGMGAERTRREAPLSKDRESFPARTPRVRLLEFIDTQGNHTFTAKQALEAVPDMEPKRLYNLLTQLKKKGDLEGVRRGVYRST